MEKIVLLDTSVGSTNKGDEIIVRCIEEELAPLLCKYYVLKIPTHLCAFSALECIGHLPDSAAEVASSKYKFVCGTNLLADKMLHRTNQWNVNLLNCRPIKDSILVGVGGLKTGRLDRYTSALYRKVLSKQYLHSVRDQQAYDLLNRLGIKCLNTGCVTLWKLIPEFCAKIPTEKADRVIFTLTDYRRDREIDKYLVETIKKNYHKVYFWIQGIHDLEYLQELTDISGIKIVGPSVNEYEHILNKYKPIDYVGTRLHAGIFAMRHGIRSIFICVDSRMHAMSACMVNNCLDRRDIYLLEDKIIAPLTTSVKLDWDALEMWKGQFE